MKKMIRKIRGSGGESISETLVALLIAALALVMLASMISSASSMVTKSKALFAEYYDTSNDLASGSGSGSNLNVTISDGTLTVSREVTVYQNTELGSVPVTSYRAAASAGGGSAEGGTGG